MLRKRTRSLHKDQEMVHQPVFGSAGCDSENVGYNLRTNPFFNVPGLFVGLSSKGLSDSDSVRSPTSPLDFRVFSKLGKPFRSLKSDIDGNQKVEICCKVGLSIVDSLDDEDFKVSGKILRSSESKNILFSPRMKVKSPFNQSHGDSFGVSRSLPKNFQILPQTQFRSPLQKDSSDVVFEIGDNPLEHEPGKFCSDPSLSSSADPLSGSGSMNLQNPQHGQSNSGLVSIGSGNGLIGSLSASDIELSEDYTCVISHGPNPRTTHIFCDCVIDCHPNQTTNIGKKEEKKIEFPQTIGRSEIPTTHPSNKFLRFCDFCNKKLEDGKDIYIYRFLELYLGFIVVYCKWII